MAVGVELGHHNKQLSDHAGLGEIAKLTVLASITVSNKRQHADKVAPGTNLPSRIKRRTYQCNGSLAVDLRNRSFRHHSAEVLPVFGARMNVVIKGGVA